MTSVASLLGVKGRRKQKVFVVVDFRAGTDSESTVCRAPSWPALNLNSTQLKFTNSLRNNRFANDITPSNPTTDGTNICAHNVDFEVSKHVLIQYTAG